MYFEELMMFAPAWIEFRWSVKVPETCLHQNCSGMPNVRFQYQYFAVCISVHHERLCSCQGIVQIMKQTLHSACIFNSGVVYSSRCKKSKSLAVSFYNNYTQFCSIHKINDTQ